VGQVGSPLDLGSRFLPNNAGSNPAT